MECEIKLIFAFYIINRMSVALIQKYFPELSEKQIEQFSNLESLYGEWNEKINVISRKDMESLYEKHILHSLGIAKIMEFAPNTKVLDVGTGGGFPGIPLAILFPETQFTLIDSIGKKITVVNAVAEGIGLKNLTAIHGRAEKVKEKFHFVVSRAVTQMPEFLRWLKGKFEKEQFNTKHNGVLYLKGGDLAEELAGLKCELFNLKNYFEEEFFDTKKVVYLSKGNFNS
jgi:16S rRNA (guanine527-N7)-methyltransferase